MYISIISSVWVGVSSVGVSSVVYQTQLKNQKPCCLGMITESDKA